jgi:23S rRNA (cytosine1962-C5)-methyltransferase
MNKYYDLPGALTEEDADRQLEMIANRVRKRFKQLKKGFKRQNIDVFRLYDWDIPEIRMVIDWYAGHLVIAEYQREQTQSVEDWLPRMAKAAADAIGVAEDKTHLKTRTTGHDESGARYERMAKKSERLVVCERDLKFYVDLDDYIDTGLFSDHRDTRALIKSESSGQRFLNLYCYTGAFTCAAVSGGASASTSVDLSNNYLGWAEENLALNELENGPHLFIKSDCTEFIESMRRQKKTWDVCVLDPPSFSTTHGDQNRFEIQDDHPQLIKSVMNLIEPGGKIYFSTNHQRFEPQLRGLGAKEVKEITEATMPSDYRNRQIHRCWQITV